MKVLFDYQAFIQRVGGVSRYHCELIKRLPQYGVTPNIPWIFSENLYLNETGVRHGYFLKHLQRPMKTNAYKWFNQKCCIQALDKKDWEVFHPTFVNPYYIEHTKGKPVVVTVHDLIHERMSRFDSEVVKKKRRIQLEHANAFIVISEETKRDLLDYYGNIVDERKVKVIYHGIEQTLIHCEDKPLLRQPYILYIGTREWHKNFISLVKALPYIPKDIFLVCTGKAFSKEELELFSRLRIEDRVKQKFVSDSELQNLLCHAIAFVYPSIMEGFGLPILEAFRCGCPTIISDIMCFHEVAGNAAQYFDPHEIDSIAYTINTTIENKVLLKKIVKEGYRRLKLFTWDITASRTADVYKQLCM